MIVDANGVELGVLDMGSGILTRNVGSELMSLSVSPQGFVQRSTTFYHTSTDCTGPRYLPNNGGVFAYFGWYIGTALFFTRLSDASNPMAPDPFNSYETLAPGADPLVKGPCTRYALGQQSAGLAEMVLDSGLSSFATPFRLR